MAVAQGTESDDEDEAESDTESAEIPELVPEITLDKQIKAKVEEAAELLKQAELDAEEHQVKGDDEKKNVAAEDKPASEQPAAPAVEASPEPAPIATPPPVVQAPKPVVTPEPPAAEEEPEVEVKKADAELEKIAVDLSRAKTIDDVDDKMAETLFGEEFSDIAAQIAAKVAAELPANDDLETAIEEPAAAMPAPEFDGAAAVSVAPPTPEPDIEAASPALSSTQQRLATVRALNGAPNVMPPLPPSAESIVMANDAAKPGLAAVSDKPESIEDQINTSITQTLKALNVRPAPGFVVEDNDDEKKGFFNRFRKS